MFTPSTNIDKEAESWRKFLENVPSYHTIGCEHLRCNCEEEIKAFIRTVHNAGAEMGRKQVIDCLPEEARVNQLYDEGYGWNNYRFQLLDALKSKGIIK